MTRFLRAVANWWRCILHGHDWGYQPGQPLPKACRRCGYPLADYLADQDPW